MAVSLPHVHDYHVRFSIFSQLLSSLLAAALAKPQPCFLQAMVVHWGDPLLPGLLFGGRPGVEGEFLLDFLR